MVQQTKRLLPPQVMAEAGAENCAIATLSRSLRALLMPLWLEPEAQQVLLVARPFLPMAAIALSIRRPLLLEAVLAAHPMPLAARVVQAEQEQAAETAVMVAAVTTAVAAVAAVARAVIPVQVAMVALAMVALTAMRAIAVLEAVAAVDAEAAPLLSLEALAAAPPLVVKERQAQEPLRPQGSLVAAVLEA